MKKFITLLLTFTMAISLCSCGGKTSENNENTQAVKNENKIDITTDKGILKYVNVYKADSGLVNGENAAVFEFEFTNKQDTPEHQNSAFYFEFYQNGIQMDTVRSFMMKGSEQDSLQKNSYTKIMKDASVNFGEFVKITDLSPVTIVVNTFDGKSQTMEVDISKIDNAAVNTSNTENSNTASQEKVIAIGEKIEANNFDFTLKNVEFSYEVKPKNTSSVQGNMNMMKMGVLQKLLILLIPPAKKMSNVCGLLHIAKTD